MIGKSQLESLIVEQKKSYAETARILQCNPGIVWKYAKKYGLASTHVASIAPKPLPISEIYDKYISGISIDALHREYKRPQKTIKQQLLKHYPDIVIRTMDQAKRHPDLNDPNKLRKLIADGYSASQIAAKCDTRKSVVIKAINRLGINTKSFDGEYIDLIGQHVIYYGNWFDHFRTSDECYDWLVNYGFVGLAYSKDYLIDASNKLVVPQEYALNANYANPSVTGLIIHFSQHYYKSHHKSYIPASAAWEIGNQIVLKTALAQLWNKDINIYKLLKHITKFFKDFSAVSIFKPWVARAIYNRYLPSGGIVVDPCMGWGGRLLGAVDSNIKYIGIDLNKLVIDSHITLTKFMGSRLNKPEFNVGDSSTVKLPDGDLLLTSPPYDDTEYYHGLESQCTDSRPIYDNIFNFKGIIALNIPKRHKSMCLKIAKDHGRELLEELEMKTSSFMGREKTYEPILVLKPK